jgi:hypothetical protein
MNAKIESKPVVTAPSTNKSSEISEVKQTPVELLAVKLKAEIQALDAERTALVKTTIENLKPGKPFDQSVVRDINKIETRKNRLIIARFAAMLRKNGPEVQAIVHQIIEI